jgi:putative NADPH-quinone reductase
MKRVLIVNGHPDPSPDRLCAALADAYGGGAAAAGLSVGRLDVGALEFPMLRSQRDYEQGAPCAAIADAQARMKAADHVVLVFPIWLGEAPALFKGFLEQTLRPGYAREPAGPGGLGRPLMTGRSVRIVATMAMPALAYRFYFWDHGLANLRRAVLRFVGFGPIRTTLVGSAARLTPPRAERLMDDMRALGARAR